MDLTTVVGLSLLASLQSPVLPHREHAEAERPAPRYAQLATGSLHLREAKTYQWPLKALSIGHTGASYQRYSFSEPYFHHGLDIRADAGTAVLASAGGKVVNIENYSSGPAYWEVALLDEDGFLWQYHHIDRDSIPEEIWQAFKTGGSVPAGTKLGEVYYWSVVTFGERYHHIHLNILGRDKKYLSPFLFLEPIGDKTAPVITQLGLLKSGSSISVSHVSPPYSLFAEVKDLILSPVFSVPAHEYQIMVDGGAPHFVWRFDELPGGESETKYVHDFYARNLVCGDYQCRKPIVDLGFSKDGSYRFPTAPGPHEVVLYAVDFEGNSTTSRFTWTVD